MRTTLIALLSLLAMLCLANVKADRNTPQHTASDTDTVQAFVRDSIKAEARKDSVMDAAMDSLLHSHGVISIDTLRMPGFRGDTTTIKKKQALDGPVNYAAGDSMVYDANTKLIYLYGKANVQYQNMTLDAGKMSVNMDSSLVHADAVTDSVGEKDQKPTFHQGSDEYVSDQMAYNFKTKKGFITDVSTTQGNGFVTAEHSKRDSAGTLYLEHATYTTCDAKHPHFYLKLSRAKVNPGKETVFGPAYLVVEDVPLPLGIPYGFFPFSKKYSSGFIMPSYGDETNRGFYLRDGGYYFAISDYMDLKLLGEIYTKGSWGLSLETNYKKRYKHNGNFYFSFINTKEGDKNMPDYQETKSLKVQWTHTKSSTGNTSFSARVNFASENYERKNLSSMYNPISYTQSTRASSVSFSHTFPTLDLTISGSANLTQNMRDSTIAMTLPDVTVSLSRRYPFRRKHQVGKERWYEKIGFSYTGQLSNSISTKEDKLLHSNLIKDWRNGMQHRIPIDATFQLFKYININPSLTFRDIMYTNRIMRSWDAIRQQEVCDTTYGFYNLYDWNVAISANTTLYGFYKPWKKLFGDKIIAIRHVFKPTISFTYAPDFTASRYGYIKSYDKVDEYGNVSTVEYSPYSRGIYSYPSGTKQGMVSFSVSNNLEMKVKSDRDSTGEKKISLIDELSATMSYNMAAKTKKWSDLTTRLRLKLTKNYTFSLAAVFATYAYAFNQNGSVITSDRTEWSYGRFGRFQGMSQNLSYTFNNKTWDKIKELFGGRKNRKADTGSADDDDSDAEGDLEDANVDPALRDLKNKGKNKKVKAKVDPDGYLAFAIPWSLTVSYGVTMSEDRSKPINVHRMRYPYGFTQSLNFSGYVRISDGWNISFSSGYDFDYHKVSMTTASVSRDLHCFEMSCNVVLKPYSSFNFTFRAKASELADALKWDKRSSYSSNIEWY